MEEKRKLLVVFPGLIGRKHVLEEISTIAQVYTLVERSFAEGASWSEEVVFARIEYDGSGEKEASFQRAFHTLKIFCQEKQINFDGIFCYDEFGIELSAFLAEKFGLRGTPLKMVSEIKCKSSFRKKCQKHGIATPMFCELFGLDDIYKIPKAFKFPAVLKPVKGAGSWNVRKIRNFVELEDLFPGQIKALEESTFPDDVKQHGYILEEYFAGWEVDIDGVAKDGQLIASMISDNLPAVEPYFLESGGIYPSINLNDDELSELQKLLKQVLGAFPGITGCFHFEAKINSKRILDFMGMNDSVENEGINTIPIEFNLRMGGAECPESVRAASGLSLPLLGAEIALNLKLDLPPRRKLPGIYFSGSYIREDYKEAPTYVCSVNLYPSKAGVLKKLENFLDANLMEEFQVVGIRLFTASVGKEISISNGSKSCLGWISAAGTTPIQASQNLKSAMKFVEISVKSK